MLPLPEQTALDENVHVSSRLLVAALCAVVIPYRAVAVTPRVECERDCLIRMASQYAAALVDHAPTRLPTVPGVRFTENLVPLKFGEQGLWKTATGR